MNRILLLVLILAGLGAGAWLVLHDGGAPAVADPAQSAPAAAPAAPAAGTWRGAESVVPPGSFERSELAEPDKGSADPKASAYATPAAENEGFLVRVVRKEGGAPMPFADVFFVDVGNVDQQRIRAVMMQAPSLLAMIEQLATRYRAGADGTVRVPLPADQFWLAARHETWFGVSEERAVPAGGITISCVPMSSVAARVTDAAGRPQADVPVELRAAENGRDQALLTVRTGADGIALIQPLDMIAGRAGSATFSLALGGILAEPVSKEFDPRNPPAEPLELILPAHGAIEVRVLTADGVLRTDPIFVQVVSGAAQVEPRGGPMAVEGLQGMTQDGVLRLSPIGLGQATRVRAMRGNLTTLGEALCAGPEREGEIVRAEIHEQSGASFISARAVRENGAPLADARLQYEMEVENAGSSRQMSGQLYTGADGRFRFDIEEPVLPDGAHRVLTLRNTGVPAAAEVAELDLSWSLGPGANELGDVLFAQPPLLVSGRVVDEAGAPLAGISMQARTQIYYSKDQFYWNWGDSMQARSGADGSFAIHGKTDSALIRVTGSDEKHWCAGADVVPGSAGVVVVMSAAGRVSGKLLLDDGARAEGMTLQLVSELEGDRETTHWGAMIEGDGSFSFSTVPPGRYRLELSTQGTQAALATLDGLLVLAGEDCADPRLKPFDVRGQLRVLRVRALDENGKPLRNFQVVEQRPDGSREHFWAGDDEAVVPLRETPSDLLVMLDGCLTVRIEDAVGDCEVRLVPGPRIRMILSGAGSLPAGHRLVVGLKSAAGSVQDAIGPSAEVDAAGVAEFSAPLTGLCALTLVMYGTQDNITHGAWVEMENVEIDVRPAGGTQSFTVNVDPAQLQKAVDLIAKQRGS